MMFVESKIEILPKGSRRQKTEILANLNFRQLYRRQYASNALFDIQREKKFLQQRGLERSYHAVRIKLSYSTNECLFERHVTIFLSQQISINEVLKTHKGSNHKIPYNKAKKIVQVL